MPLDTTPLDTPPEQHINTQERVLMVLMTLAQIGRPVSALELMEKTGLAKSSLYRQLTILKRWGFVFEANSLYAPGPVSLQLASGFDAASLLTQYAKHDMQLLSEQTRESVAITVAIQHQAICIDMVEGPQSLRCSFEKGRSVPLREGATAKCLLAHLPPREQDNIMATEYAEPQAREDRHKLLQEIRQRGYTVSDSEVDAGVWGVSFPLFTRNKFLLGALTLMVPSQRVSLQQDHLIQLTLSAAKRINNKLQHN